MNQPHRYRDMTIQRPGKLASVVHLFHDAADLGHILIGRLVQHQGFFRLASPGYHGYLCLRF